MYCFSLYDKYSTFLLENVHFDGIVISRRTVSVWFSFCRGRKFEELLGGPGMIVEIDECNLGKLNLIEVGVLRELGF